MLSSVDFGFLYSRTQLGRGEGMTAGTYSNKNTLKLNLLCVTATHNILELVEDEAIVHVGVLCG